MRATSVLIAVILAMTSSATFAATSCTYETRDGVRHDLALGQSIKLYRKNSVPLGNGGDCGPYSQVRTCVQGDNEPFLDKGYYEPADEYFVYGSCRSERDFATPTLAANVDADIRNRNWRLAFHDEFIRRDSDAWSFQNSPMWLGGYRLAERAKVRNGILVIENRNGDRKPAPTERRCFRSKTPCLPIHPSQAESAHLSTKQAFKYGYFEIRAQLSEGPSIDTAFWLMNDVGSEIDIFEAFFVSDDRYLITSNLHPRALEGRTRLPEFASLDLHGSLTKGGRRGHVFHTYGLLWERDVIAWFIDGEEVRRETNPEILAHFASVPADVGLKVRVSTAVSNFFKGATGKTKPLDARSFQSNLAVDYVRVFQAQ